MSLLTVDQILAADDIKYAEVPAPEWGGEVRVRSAMAFEMDDYEKSLIENKVVNDKVEVMSTTANAKARLVVKLLVDKDNQKLVPAKDEEAKAKLLGMKSHAVINRLFQKIQQLSGRGRQAAEELEKNSVTGQTNSSGSSSPVISNAEPSVS